MATGHVTVQIGGLDELRALIERLEELVEQVGAIERPLYGEVHIHSDGVSR